MRFSPKTEREIAEMGLLPAGIYPFEIVSSEDAQSKAGNDMIKLQVAVYDQEGERHVIFDYLLEQMAAKLRHAAEVCGVLSDYEKGVLSAPTLEGKTGNVKVGIQKDKTGAYPDKNVILDYVRSTGANGTSGNGMSAGPATTKSAPHPALDDDIPF